jgi:alpha-L-rhamnosidase
MGPSFLRNRLRVEMLTAVLLLWASATCGQPSPGDRPEWHASWITHPTAPLRDAGVYHFRKVIHLDAKPEHFRVLVSADNRFQLYVNGRRVGEGPARGDFSHWRYATFDLAPFLQSGENLIAATVWQFGIWAPMAQISDRLAFLLEGETTTEAIANTDKHWQVEEERGHMVRPPLPPGLWNYYVAGPGERVDLSQYDVDWNRIDSSSKHWVDAGLAMRESIFPRESIPLPPNRGTAQRWLLYPDPLPQMEFREVAPPHVARATIPSISAFPQSRATVPAHMEVSVLLDQGVVVSAYPQLVVSGGKGASIQIVYAEALYDKDQKRGKRDEIADRVALGLTDEFLPDGGRERFFMPLWWRTWRYLELRIKTADEPLELETFHTFYTGYPFEERGSFRSSDPELGRIREICWRTARLDAHETYMDTAYWEQLQYFGDTRIQALISYTVSGDDRLARQALQAAHDSLLPEGITQSRYPSSLVQIIPPFSLTYVNMLHDFWMYREDPQFVAYLLPSTREVLAWFERHRLEDGFLGHVPYWNFVDWMSGEDNFPPTDKEGRSTILTLQWIAALRDAAEMEERLGDASLAASYLRQAQRSSASVYRLCWNAKSALLADTPDQTHFSEHANALAVLYDVVPARDQVQVMRRLLGEGGSSGRTSLKVSPASYYFQFYVVAALEHAGLGDLYMDTLKPWREMLAQGFTTTPETPDPTRSDTHAWSSHPAYYLNAIVAGVRPASPNFSTVRIQPSLAKLDRVEAVTPHPEGEIRTSFKRNGDGLEASIELPGKTTGVFRWEGREYPLHPGKQQIETKR